MLHLYIQPISHIPIPIQFTYPFHYTPHPLALAAKDELMEYLSKQDTWHKELEGGKMFGVLVVKDQHGCIGYLAAFSGLLAGTYHHPHFVGPVYDMLAPTGFFKKEEHVISNINEEITALLQDQAYLKNKDELIKECNLAKIQIATLKEKNKRAKAEREIRRSSEKQTDELLASLIKESQYDKANLKRVEKSCKDRIDAIQETVNTHEEIILCLKRERKQRSAALQNRLFKEFILLNAKGETRDIASIFAQTAQKVPPAGTGECAGPKLLQYAYKNELHPIALVEFWYGKSPKTEIRHHGTCYPACMGKCYPILTHMIEGLPVEKNSLATSNLGFNDLEILWEDEDLMLINKPEGMLSVPGKEQIRSVQDLIKCEYPEITGPILVHRLDKDTSGIVLIAKNILTHKMLQKQFIDRTIKKRYCAILEGEIEAKEGIINLPLSANYLDRPRQQVDFEMGKVAITRFEVIKREKGLTKVKLYPITGRTHQLRVHMAHQEGLNCPILGDPLYGKKNRRMYLHAEYLEFTHPHSHKKIRIHAPAPF